MFAIIVLAVLAIGAGPAAAATWDLHGKVVYVDDGDTVVLLDGTNSQVKIRLASIDAPESDHSAKQRGRIGQPHSRASGKALASLVKGRQIRAGCYETDRYRRHVCDLFVDGVNANLKMVEMGWAWANQASGGRYLRDGAYLDAQARARSAGRGLWVDREPTPPWEWRKRCWKEGICN